MNSAGQTVQVIEQPQLAVKAPQAAKLLGVSVRTVWREVKEDRLKVKRVGCRVVFPVKWLQEWLEQ